MPDNLREMVYQKCRGLIEEWHQGRMTPEETLMAIVPAITMLAPHESPTSFTCPICHKEITGKSDILHRYCPVCRAFTTKCSIWACPQEPFIVVGNVVLCKPHGLEVGVVSA